MPDAGVACFAFKLGADAVPRAVTVGGDAGEEALDLLAAVRTRGLPSATVGEVNAQRRAAHSAYLSGSP